MGESRSKADNSSMQISTLRPMTIIEAYRQWTNKLKMHDASLMPEFCDEWY